MRHLILVRFLNKLSVATFVEMCKGYNVKNKGIRFFVFKFLNWKMLCYVCFIYERANQNVLGGICCQWCEIVVCALWVNL